MEGDDRTVLEETRRLLADMEADYVEFVMRSESIADGLETAAAGFEKIASGSVLRDILPNTPLSLEEAACLPVFGGVLCVEASFNRQGNVSAKVLRDAINDGRLGHVGLNAKNRKVTLELIEQWIASCQEQPSPRILSGSSLSITKRQVSSSRGAIGPSSTARSSLALDSGLSIVQRLRGSGTNTK